MRIGLQGNGAKRGRLRQRGSALVEQALVIAMLLSVMFGIIDCARALYTYHFVANAAREATRWASVRGSSCNASLTGCQANPINVGAYVKNVSGMGLDPSLITATPSWPSATPGCATKNNPGCVVQVQVVYNYHFFFPLLPTSQITMQSTSEMVITQ